MRAAVVGFALLAGCGFTANPGQADPGLDAARPIDAPGSIQPDDGNNGGGGMQCPGGYGSLPALTGSTSKYRFVAGALSWNGAEADCEDDAGPGRRATHLIVLDSAAERDAMIGGPNGNANLTDQWIGATDLAKEGELRYVTAQSTTFDPAASGNADNKDCVRIKNTGVAEYRSCVETNAYVCECDGTPADPGTYPNFPNGND